MQCEIKGFEKLWLGWAGTPIVLRCHMSGAHMSDEFASWCDGHGIKLELIAKAHHKLAIQERNHAVRRNLLLTYEKMYPLDSLKKAICVHVGRSEPFAECERVLSHSACFGFSASHSCHLV